MAPHTAGPSASLLRAPDPAVMPPLRAGGAARTMALQGLPVSAAGRAQALTAITSMTGDLADYLDRMAARLVRGGPPPEGMRAAAMHLRKSHAHLMNAARAVAVPPGGEGPGSDPAVHAVRQAVAATRILADPAGPVPAAGTAQDTALTGITTAVDAITARLGQEPGIQKPGALQSAAAHLGAAARQAAAAQGQSRENRARRAAGLGFAPGFRPSPPGPGRAAGSRLRPSQARQSLARPYVRQQ